MAASEGTSDDSLYPIAVLIDELRNEDVQVCSKYQKPTVDCNYFGRSALGWLYAEDDGDCLGRGGFVPVY